MKATKAGSAWILRLCSLNIQALIWCLMTVHMILGNYRRCEMRHNGAPR